MRVTELQSYSLLVNSIQRARAKAQVTQEQISTGKKVVKPSDDANAFDRIVATKSSMAKAEQHARNLDIATNRLDLTDSALRSVTTVFGRVKELAVQFASNTNGPAERAMGAQEVRQLFLQLQELGNVQNSNGQAVFGGTSLHGRATGVAIAAPVSLTSGSNDSLVVTVDGTTSGTISLGSAAALSGSGLAALVQRKINTDASLSAAGKSVTVTFDTDHLVIASNSSGQTSSVEATGGTSLRSLGLSGGSATTGANAFVLQAMAGAAVRNSGGALLAQGSVYDRNAVTLDDYMVKFSAASNASTPVLVTANGANTGGASIVDSRVMDASKVTQDNYNLNVANIYTVTTGVNDGIQFDPDGVGVAVPVTATLAAGSYTGTELAAQIKAAMEAVSGGATYTVSFNDTTGKFGITNNVANGVPLDLLSTTSTAKTLLGLTGADQLAIAAGGTGVSDVDTTGLAGVSLRHLVNDATLGSNIFNITAANNTLIVDDSAGTERTITVTPGSYTGAQLATELATQLNANRDVANTVAYTVGYGTVTAGRFTINNPALNANSLLLKFGHASSTASQILGSTAVTVTETVGGSASTLNSDAGYTTYSSGATVDFSGFRVVLKDGASGPRNGDNYLVRLNAATTFDVYNSSTPVTASANSTNTGGAVKSDSGVVDPSKVTLDNYEVRLKNIYTVTTGTNDGIQFDPGTGPVTATLTAGAYTGTELAAQIKTAMEAVSGGKTYTVSFNGTTGKFDITNDVANAATLDLRYSNAASTAKSLLGSNGADRNGIAAGGTVTSDLDTSSLAGVSKQQNVYNSTLATNILNITSANNTVVVNDSAGGLGADRTITLTAGSYTGAQLAAELESQLNASRPGANANAYTVSYGIVTDGRFTINNPAGNGNSLVMKFGNAGSTAAQILGSTPVTVTETAGASASTLNSDAGYATYQSGSNIEFDGLRVVLQDGASGPRNGDAFSVSQARKIILSNQSYVSGGAIRVNGVQLSLRSGGAAPASGDSFKVQTGVQYQGDEGLQTIEIGDGQTVKTNKPGSQTFTGSTIDIFASVKGLMASLNGNYGGGIQVGLAGIDVAVDQVSSVQGELGALSNRLGATKVSLDETKAFLSNLLSTNEDVDLVVAISNLTLQQQAIEAAGATLNRIFQSSLLNFLK